MKKRTKNGKSTQPCWTCKKACGGCSWSSKLKPVKGWKAKKVQKHEHGHNWETYRIEHCPEYEEE